jgi:formate/nitrite transporter FocA (FNT family)
MQQIVILSFVAAILVSLGSALVYLIRDRGQSTRTVKALTFRIAFSIALFVLLMLGYYLGLVEPRMYH